MNVRGCIGPIRMVMDLLVFTSEEIEAEGNDGASIVPGMMRNRKVVYGFA